MDSITRTNVFSVEAVNRLMKEVIQAVNRLMKEVIQEEESREILQANLIRMVYLLPYITIFPEDQRPEVWLQLLHNCLTHAKSILHRSNSRQRCLDCVSNNAGRASTQIENWRLHFNYLFQTLESEFSVFVRGREAVIAPVIAPIFPLMKEVIEEEENRQILHTELRCADDLLVDISVVFQDQQKAALEALKIWLQLLQNSVTEANTMLHTYCPSQPQRRRLCCLKGNPGRPSQQVKEWKVLFNFLFQGLQQEFSMFVTSRSHFIINKNPIQLESESKDESNPLSEDEDIEESGDEAEISTNKAEESKDRVESSTGESQRSTDEDIEESGDEAEVSTNKAEESKDRAESSTGESQRSTDEAEQLEQPLSKDEAWMLFRRIAFKDNPAPTDIEVCAKNIVDECKGFRLAITLVAAAMRGKNRVDEWRTSLSSIKSHADSSSRPDTLHPRCIDPELYPLLRWSYDALPNSDVKNCFLYCAMYPKDENINVQELVQMWIAEGFVRSKQGDHLMDMAIGRSYVNLLVDRCFFQNDINEKDTVRFWVYSWVERITVHHVVQKMAIYIGEEEENGLFKAGQQLQNFPTIHNKDFKRISVSKNDIENLPAEFPCPKMVSLMLSFNSIEEVPPGFLVSLTSLKVLRLDGSGIKSIPSSVGQLKQLEFLSLRGLENITDLPEEIGQLSSLQFLDLEDCSRLQSLPSKIGQLKNLKFLSLQYCRALKVIPHEIYQLTSLSTLNSHQVDLSVKRSNSRLKGLRNLTMLRLSVNSGKLEEGIMGTWLDMRHLYLVDFEENVDLPHDMKKMSKLQLLEIWGYRSSLPDYICNFQHLQEIWLGHCDKLLDLSLLKRVPNLKVLRLAQCDGLKELGIGNSGPFLMLEKLVLERLWNLKSIGEASNNGVWNESTLPRLRTLGITQCPGLKRLPVGMDKLPNLSAIFGQKYWWAQIIWEDDDMKKRLQKLYKKW